MIISLLMFALATTAVWGQQSRDRARHAEAEAALAFAQKHHPELAQLLKRLKSADQPAFRKAIDDLSQARRRLTRLQERDSERYDAALRIWSLDSRIRLLVARSTMNDKHDVESRLRRLLRERQQTRLTLLRLEQERLQSRLEHVRQQMTRLEDRPQEALDNDLARIQRGMKSAKGRDGDVGMDKKKQPSRKDGAEAKQRSK